MSKCNKCGADANEDGKYCKSCGTSLSGNGAMNDKKARVLDREKTWSKPAIIAAAVVLVVAALWGGRNVIMAKRMGDHPLFSPHRDGSARLVNAMPVSAQGGDIRIPVKTIEDGNAHFFSYPAAGSKTITFFVMKAMDGSIHTALDACVACNHAKLGYRQEGSLVVCNNCGMGFKPTDIGMATGGCNPIVVNKTIDGEAIVLKAKDLENGAKYFGSIA